VSAPAGAAETALPYGDGVSFWMLAEIVKAQAAILEADEDAEQKLARAVADVSSRDLPSDPSFRLVA
jgi:hypothetical protein